MKNITSLLTRGWEELKRIYASLLRKHRENPGAAEMLLTLCAVLLFGLLLPIASVASSQKPSGDADASGSPAVLEEAAAEEAAAEGAESALEAVQEAAETIAEVPEQAETLQAEDIEDEAEVEITDDAVLTLAAVTTRFRSADEDVSVLTSQKDTPELPYLIYVSKESFTIAILGLDDDGEYTKLLHTFHTAVGRSSGQTRAGSYTITSRERWHRWGTNSYSPYAVRHSGGLYFHGPIFSAKDSYTLNARSYNQIGTNATSGCMRTYTAVAAWIYYNCPTGTPVIIANDSKYTSSPRAQIDASQRYDPTDPDINR